MEVSTELKVSSKLNKAPNSRIYVAVAGNIGTGKTTLSRLLSERFGWEPHYEVVQDNPYLADFYADMARWSFPIQIFFLNSRFKAHQKIIRGTNSAIQDRCIYEDANIFARNLHESGFMGARDYSTYLDIYEEICKQLEPPDVLVFLRKSLPNLQKNISKRGRDYEQTIAPEYLANLNRYYDDWIASYSHGKKLVIDSDDLDFVESQKDFDHIAERIVHTLDQREMFF